MRKNQSEVTVSILECGSEIFGGLDTCGVILLVLVISSNQNGIEEDNIAPSSSNYVNKNRKKPEERQGRLCFAM